MQHIAALLSFEPFSSPGTDQNTLTTRWIIQNAAAAPSE
jgi:hypothetical protein